MPYSIANLRVDWVKFSPGVRTWFLRSVGSTQNIFFSESFVDELAHAAGKDPFEFRRALLEKHPRHKAVLELAAEKAGWGSPLPAGRARGIAVAESFGNSSRRWLKSRWRASGRACIASSLRPTSAPW
jgi:isoquinoline 1-oxidoreductase beta subunit